jgi:ABC-type phosphate/phosphonate transport system substrate-binding protein
VVATTQPAPIPPLVAAAAVDAASARRLAAALRAVGDEPALAALRDALCLAGFAAADPADYAVTEQRAAASVAAGYAELG